MVLKIKNAIIVIAVTASIITLYSIGSKINAPTNSDDFIKWVDFNVNLKCMRDTLKIDIETNADDYPISWIDQIAYLACIYGNDFSKYTKKDLDKFTDKIKSGKTVEEITENLKHFNYYKESYGAVLDGFVGDYETIQSDGTAEKYGLKVFSPIARGYSYNHYDDFGASRSYGYKRRHLGNDLMGAIGTPVVAVEDGYIEAIGWNQYGGWRIGIRSFDKKRYYYYAHLRKDKPYAQDFKVGDEVRAGSIIGYLGMTGYSKKENVNNINIPHLHFGMQIIFDESQKNGNGEIWIDVFDIINLLSQNKSLG